MFVPVSRTRSPAAGLNTGGATLLSVAFVTASSVRFAASVSATAPWMGFVPAV